MVIGRREVGVGVVNDSEPVNTKSVVRYSNE